MAFVKTNINMDISEGIDGNTSRDTINMDTNRKIRYYANNQKYIYLLSVGIACYIGFKMYNTMFKKSVKMKQDDNKFKIYTKNGDNYESCLYNMQKRNKSDIIFEGLGTCDELNASIGIAIEYCKQAGNGLGMEIIYYYVYM